MVLAMALAVGMAASAAKGQLIGYWKLDETEGSVAHEEMQMGLALDPPQNYDALAIVNPYWDPSNGVLNGSCYFHGLAERFQVPEYDNTLLEVLATSITHPL